MNRYRRFLIIYIFILPCFMIPICSIGDFIVRIDKTTTFKIIWALYNNPIDILYFGDSVIGAYESGDKRREGIDKILQKQTGLSILLIAHGAFSPIIYKNYVKLLSNTRYKPKLVIIPINLRSFSDEWFTNPVYQIKMNQIYVDLISKYKLDIIEYIRYRFFNIEQRLIDKWKNSEVVYDGFALGKVKNIKIEGLKDISLTFRFHYMNTIDDNHQMFNYMGELFKELNILNIKYIVYITPIDVDDGVKLVGPSFKDKINKNIKTITRYLNENRVNYLNLATSLSSEYFIDKKNACEHVNYEGKYFIANKLANAIKYP